MSAEEEECRQCGEDCKRDHLHDDAGDCNVASKLQLTGIAFGARGQPSTSGLETQRYAIAANEEPSVISRLEIAVLGSVCFDDVLQGQIYAHGEPSGAHDQTADLHGETVVGEGVVVQHEAADVTDCFYKTAAGEREGECPRFVSDAEVELSDQEGEEKGEEEGVGGEGREVAID